MRSAQAITPALPPSFIDRHFWLTIGLIAALMFGLRLSQIGQGLPDVQISDENSDLSTTAWLLAGKIQPDVRYHRIIISYIEVIGFGAVYVLNVLRTGNPSLEAFRDLYFSNRADFVFASRFLLLIFSVVALVALADLMRRSVSKTAGVIAALLLCFYYFLDLHSVYAMPDSLIASAVIYFMWSTILVFQKGSRLSYALAGFTLAFVMMCKITALPVGLGLVMAHLFHVRQPTQTSQIGQFLRRLILNDGVAVAAAGFILGSVILNPLAFTHLSTVRWELGEFYASGYESFPQTSVNVSVASSVANTTYQKTLSFFQDYIGVPLGLSLLIGGVAIFLPLLKTGARQAGLIFLGAGFVTWLAMAASARSAKPSYWIPSMPLMLMVVTVGLVAILELTRRYGRAVYLVGICAVAAVILNEGYVTAKTISVIRNDYTFEQAQRYINQNWPNSSTILMGPESTFSVPLHRSPISIERAVSLGAPDLQSWAWWLRQPVDFRQRQYEYNIYGPEFEPQIKTYEDTYRLILSKRIRYVIDVDTCIGSDNRPGATSTQEFPALNDELRSRLHLVAVFSPFEDGLRCPVQVEDRLNFHARNDVFSLQRLGPVIRLYETDVSNDTMQAF